MLAIIPNGTRQQKAALPAGWLDPATGSTHHRCGSSFALVVESLRFRDGSAPAPPGRRSATVLTQQPVVVVPPVPHQPIPPYLPNSQNLAAVEMVNRCSSTNSSSGNLSP